MKNILLFFLFFSCSTAIAQKKVPEKILSAFNAKFPEATNVVWGSEGDEPYEAKFEMKGKKFSANFSSKGEWKETEVEITSFDLPTIVLNTFRSKHNAAEIRVIEKIATNKGLIIYEIQYTEGNKSKEIHYDELGNQVKY